MIAFAGWALALLAGTAWLRGVLRARVREELIACAGHEVRGPLTAASLALHALARPRPGPAGPSSIAAVQRELTRAGVALEDLAAAGRGRRLRDRPEPVDVRELLAVQAATWRPVARAFGTELRVRGTPVDSTVRVDRVRLVQATANLIVNALEHGGGTVTLGASTRRDRVSIEVADEGTGGVPPTVAFGAVADPDGRSAAGTGAGRASVRPGGSRGRGLAIVADIAARHGGRLVVDRADRGGTRMAVELPRADVPRADR